MEARCSSHALKCTPQDCKPAFGRHFESCCFGLYCCLLLVSFRAMHPSRPPLPPLPSLSPLPPLAPLTPLPTLPAHPSPQDQHQAPGSAHPQPVPPAPAQQRGTGGQRRGRGLVLHPGRAGGQGGGGPGQRRGCDGRLEVGWGGAEGGTRGWHEGGRCMQVRAGEVLGGWGSSSPGGLGSSSPGGLGVLITWGAGGPHHLGVWGSGGPHQFLSLSVSGSCACIPTRLPPPPPALPYPALPARYACEGTRTASI